MNIAVILAGGSGTRLGGDLPKQLIDVNGKTMMEYTIEAFESHRMIDIILVVSKAEYIPDVHKIIAKNGYRKVSKVLAGGTTRYESSLNAIRSCNDGDDILLFHDCARPLVSHRIIDDCIFAMKDYDAVTVAIPATDTIYITSDGEITSIPDRRTLQNAQTPQCFRLDIIREAYSRALKDTSFVPTDDTSVVFRYMPEVKIKVVEGSADNIKVTYPKDLEVIKPKD